MGKILCITGMHRSGTSLTASWLEKFGLTIYDKNFLGCNLSNPKGHFEDIDFLEFQEEVILSRFPKSKGWIVTGGDQIVFNDAESVKANNLILRRNDKYGTWGWKDPRSVILLEQWKELIPELKVLSTWRPCFDVVASISNRAKITRNPMMRVSVVDSIKMWAYYNKKLIDFKLAYPDEAILLPLDLILNHDKKVFEAINEKLNLELSYIPLTSVYNNKFSRNQPALLNHPFIKLIMKIYKVSEIEKTLNSLSLMP